MSFVNLLTKLICQTPWEKCDTALSSECFLLWKHLLEYIKNTKNIWNLLLLHSSWGVLLIPGHAPDIFGVESCDAMHSSKNV